MDIYLYKYSGMKTAIYKSANLTQYAHLEGVLREESSIINPVVVVQLETAVDGGGNPTYTEASEFNYAYIPQFKRYYFVEDVVSVANKLWRLHLHVDVLMTYESDIVNDNRVYFIERCDTTFDSNPKINDELVSFLDSETVTITDLTNTNISSLKNFSFDVDVNANTELRSTLYVFVDSAVRDNIASYVAFPLGSAPWENDITAPTVGGNSIGLPDVSPFMSQLNTLEIPYALRLTQLSEVARKVVADDTYLDWIMGAVIWPFLIDFDWTTDTDTYALGIGHQYPVLDAQSNPVKRMCMLYGPYMPYLILCSFNAPSITDYTDLPPHASYEVYIPYYGWTQLDISACAGHNLIVYYALSLADGSGAVHLYDVTAKSDLFSAQVQVGQKIALSATNFRENRNQGISIALNSALGLVSSGLAVGVGVATGNPLAVAGGLISGASTLGKGAVQALSQLDHANVNFMGDPSALLTPTNCYIRKKKKDAIMTVNSQAYSYFGSFMGRPYKKASVIKTTPQKHGYMCMSGAKVPSEQATDAEIKEIETILNTGFYL